MPDRICVLFPQIPDYSHLIDSCNTKHNDLTFADNDNRHIVLRDQDVQPWLCFLWIARVVQLAIQHKDAWLHLSAYHYPWLTNTSFFIFQMI